MNTTIPSSLPRASFGNPTRMYLLLTFFVFLNTKATVAQDVTRFGQKGAMEAGGSISYMSETSVFNGNTNTTLSVLSIEPYIGYFISDNFELGLNPFGLTHISVGGSSFYQVRILAAPAYHFKSLGSDFMFLEPLVGYTALLNGDTRDGMSWGGRAGIKLAVVEGGLLVFAAQYLVIDLSPSSATARSGYNEFTVSIGFNVWR